MILSDIVDSLKDYMPYAFSSGLLFIALLCFFKGKRQFFRQSLSFQLRMFLLYIFYIYCFMVLSITFLSREPGSRTYVDLALFSTISKQWDKNLYPLENILLFIPLGFFLPLLWNQFKHLKNCLKAGLLFSLIIEYSQLVTGRGYCQTDDVLTNVLGTLVGYIGFCCYEYVKGRYMEREE